MKKIYYRETQKMRIFVFAMCIIGGLVLIASIFQWGSKPIPIGLGLLIALLFVGLLLPFHNLTIRVCESHATVKFGIGWLKRQVLLDNLDLNTVQIIDLPWYVGIGYRISTEGTFFNTKPGPALLIKTKDGSPPLFVGTNNYEEIITTIQSIQKS